MSLVLTDLANTTLLSNATAHVTSGSFSGMLHAVYVGLFTNSTIPNSGWLMSMITEPDFTGYARVGPIVWSSQYTQPDGSYAISDGTVEDYQPSDNVGLPQTVYGIFLADASTAGNLLAMQVFPDGPITLNSHTDAVLFVSQFAIGNGSVGGSGSVID